MRDSVIILGKKIQVLLNNGLNKNQLKMILIQYIPLFSLTSLIVVIDQVSKAWIRSNILLGQRIIPIDALGPFFGIVNWTNTGVAFGLFQNQGSLFTFLAIIVSIVIIYYFPSIAREDWPLRVALGLQLGGAIGNLIDRILFGEVTDFISIGHFPVFNVADSSISIGIVVLIFGFWMQDRHNKKLLTGNDNEIRLPKESSLDED